MSRLAQFAAVLLPAIISGAEGASIEVAWSDEGDLVIEAECGDWRLTVTAAVAPNDPDERVQANFRTVAPGECVVGEVTDWAQGSQSLAAWLDAGQLQEHGLRFVQEAR